MEKTESPNDFYKSLATLRYHIRRFVRFSEQAAREADLRPQQHQLLLAIKGREQAAQPSVGDLAERLQLQHHSVVELIDRMVARGLVVRNRANCDKRTVLISLTPAGERVLRTLSLRHQQELRKQAPELIRALRNVVRN